MNKWEGRGRVVNNGYCSMMTPGTCSRSILGHQMESTPAWIP